MKRPAVDSQGKWVLVTGAAGGIGAETVRVLAGAGFGVLAAARRNPEAFDLPTTGYDRVRKLSLDVTDDRAVREMPARVREITGQDRLFGLVNNAGIAIPGAFECSSMDDARRQIDTNVVGTLSLTHALLPLIRAARGRIVVISSIAGRLGMPFNAVHTGTKHFLEGAFDALRVELRGVGVETVIIEPGTIGTPMVEKFSESASAAISRVPPELEDLYARPVRAMATELEGHIDRGSPPSVVAEAVLKALTVSRPRTRYPVGRKARPLTTLARVLPDRRKDALISRVLGL